jgi:hypothetical protein
LSQVEKKDKRIVEKKWIWVAEKITAGSNINLKLSFSECVLAEI